MQNGRPFRRDRFAVSLQEHLEKLFDSKINNIENNIIEARRTMESRMDGFPSEFARKEEVRALSETVGLLMATQAKLEGKASQHALMVVLTVSITSFVMGLFALVLRFLKI